MASTARTLLWAWVIAKSFASPVGLPEISNEAFIDECVREHNRARSSVVPAASDMLYMVGLTGTNPRANQNLQKTKVLAALKAKAVEVPLASLLSVSTECFMAFVVTVTSLES